MIFFVVSFVFAVLVPGLVAWYVWWCLWAPFHRKPAPSPPKEIDWNAEELAEWDAAYRKATGKHPFPTPHRSVHMIPDGGMEWTNAQVERAGQSRQEYLQWWQVEKRRSAE